MKTAIVVAFCLWQVTTPSPAPPGQKSADSAQQETKPNKQIPQPLSTASVTEKNAPQKSSDEHSATVEGTDNKWTIRNMSTPPSSAGETISLICTILLTLVGIIGIGIAVCTLIKIERQTKATETAAQATRESVSILINKERARIQVEPLGVRIEDSPDEYVSPIREMKYRVKCVGTTQATILENRVWAEISVSENPVYRGSYAPMIGLPRIVAPTDEVVELITNLQGDEDSFPVLLDEGLDDRRLFLNFRGLIKYQDIFSDEYVWVYTFRYTWFAYPNGEGGHWITGGEACENDEVREKLPKRPN